MCNEECSDLEECLYEKENCEYKCIPIFEIDEYSYSNTKQVAVTSGLVAFLAAINFPF